MTNQAPPKFLNIEERGPQSGLVTAWSFSVLSDFERCNYAVYLSKIAKAPRFESPHAERGNLLHDQAEQYTLGNLPDLPKNLAKYYGPRFEDLRKQYDQGLVTCEEDWAFTHEWEPCGWMDDNVWARIKLDAFVKDSDTSGRVIDHKSGKPYPIKHHQQGQLYAISAFLREPELQFIQTEFWYLDKTPDPMINTYTRDQAMYYLPGWTQRAEKLTRATKFPPNPSTRNCAFCDHAKTGACDYRIV